MPAFPHDHKVPSFLTPAEVLFIETCEKLPANTTGLFLLVVSFNPSCPKVLSPQTYISPLTCNAPIALAPYGMFWKFAPVNITGLLLGTTFPIPSCPDELAPQTNRS